MGSAFVSKAGREGIALSVSIKVKLILCRRVSYLHALDVNSSRFQR